MFREMRRKKQLLPAAMTAAVLQRNTSGVLAVSGEDGYPYAVPLSYVYAEGKLWFHSARNGHKLDAIMRQEKVSFCVVDQDEIVPERYTTHFRSAIAFGRVRVVTDAAMKRRVLELLADKYAPQNSPAARAQEIDGQLAHTAVLELTIEHLTGKEAIELVRAREGMPS